MLFTADITPVAPHHTTPNSQPLAADTTLFTRHIIRFSSHSTPALPAHTTQPSTGPLGRLHSVEKLIHPKTGCFTKP
ncbi:hypothetical protein E2C01_098342 [Portunus trituberculatus]|uniref:Uncharacterized protein n=1 Tax=Portunus trituberculatus TaxID=210409 RepID=A0A5B7K0Z9_PORTR|nr:hypothetical protein [Portunus trituberculatus]